MTMKVPDAPRWPTPEAADAAHAEFMAAARRYIAQGRDRRAQSDTEFLALRLVGLVAVMFHGAPDEEDGAVMLQSALRGLLHEMGTERESVQAVRAIHRAGEAWLNVANDEARTRILVDTAMELSTWDYEAFDALGDGINSVPMTADLVWLSSKLDAYHPNPRGLSGKKSAERILAEIIFYDCPGGTAFGIKSDDEAPEGDFTDEAVRESEDVAIEAIRHRLSKNMAKFKDAVKKAKP